MTTTDTPRTDACPHCGAEEIPYTILIRNFDCGTLIAKMGGTTRRTKLCHEREARQKVEAEVERLRELLNRAINEIEKTPFHTPKLTAFTAHRLADRYREKMTNTSTKPIESQEDDK